MVLAKKQKASKKNAFGQIRIIGGSWRGRKLKVPQVEGLRPTPDRTRETLFNWLSPIIQGANCLDLFTGSGALGLEAASRGAEQVYLVDTHSEVSKQLKAHIQTLKSSNLSFTKSDAKSFLNKTSIPMDIIFLDPPFNQQILPDIIHLLEKNNWLKSTSWIYIESESELVELEVPLSWQLHREKVSGQVCSRLYVKKEL